MFECFLIFSLVTLLVSNRLRILVGALMAGVPVSHFVDMSKTAISLTVERVLLMSLAKDSNFFLDRLYFSFMPTHPSSIKEQLLVIFYSEV